MNIEIEDLKNECMELIEKINLYIINKEMGVIF